MLDRQNDEGGGDIKELMQRYQNLKLGRANAYIEEDDIERIIEHLDEKDEKVKGSYMKKMKKCNISLV